MGPPERPCPPAAGAGGSPVAGGVDGGEGHPPARGRGGVAVPGPAVEDNLELGADGAPGPAAGDGAAS
eukprot:5056092-Alexandrium_andersonii.AAC.1